MKKLISAVLALSLALSLAACAGNPSSESQSTAEESSSVATDSSEDATAETGATGEVLSLSLIHISEPTRP